MKRIVFILKNECRGRDLNPRTQFSPLGKTFPKKALRDRISSPAYTEVSFSRLKSCAFGQALLPRHIFFRRGAISFKNLSLTRTLEVSLLFFAQKLWQQLIIIAALVHNPSQAMDKANQPAHSANDTAIVFYAVISFF